MLTLKRLSLIVIMGFALAFVAISFSAMDANALTINILCSESEGCGLYTGTTADGTTFTANPNPTEPSTGTGVFEPFVRIQEPKKNADGLQNGYNTDAGNPGINFDTKNGSNWTRSVMFSELGLINGNYVLQLDANQLGKATSIENQITITDMQIYIGGTGFDNPEATLGYTGTPFDSSDNSLLNAAPVWTLDSAINGDVDVVVQASICDTPGQCGSGHGDLDVFIPQGLFSGSDTDYFVLYTEYSGANDGFEEWRFNSQEVPVPEPATLLLIGCGLISLAGFRRKLRKN